MLNTGMMGVYWYKILLFSLISVGLASSQNATPGPGNNNFNLSDPLGQLPSTTITPTSHVTASSSNSKIRLIGKAITSTTRQHSSQPISLTSSASLLISSVSNVDVRSSRSLDTSLVRPVSTLTLSTRSTSSPVRNLTLTPSSVFNSSFFVRTIPSTPTISTLLTQSTTTATNVSVSQSNSDGLPAEPFILYSNTTNLRSLDLVSFVQANVLGGQNRIIPLGVDTVYQHIYFGDYNLGRISRSNYDGSNVSVIMEGAEQIEGLAVDWINRLMYWTSYASATIEVATLDGLYRTVLINTGLEYPRGMAVDPIAGYFFWSDWGSSPAIERSFLDGSNRATLVTNNITWPNGITLDISQRLVYWIDASHDTVSCVDYEGKNRRLIFENTSLSLLNLHGFDLDISGDYLYFSDWQGNAIYEVKISSGSLVRNISVPTVHSGRGVMGLRVIHSAKQPAATSNCDNDNGGCEQLCFHKVPSGTSCGCQLGMKLASDGKSCQHDSSQLISLSSSASLLTSSVSNVDMISSTSLDTSSARPVSTFTLSTGSTSSSVRNLTPTPSSAFNSSFFVRAIPSTPTILTLLTQSTSTATNISVSPSNSVNATSSFTTLPDFINSSTLAPSSTFFIVNISVEIKLSNKTFNEELRNESSPAYIELKNDVYTELYNLFNNTPGFEDIEILGFVNGSVKVLFKVIVKVLKPSKETNDVVAVTVGKKIYKQLKTGRIGKFTVIPSTLKLNAKPPPPANVSYSDVRETKVDIFWFPPELHELFSIERYYISYLKHGDAKWSNDTVSAYVDNLNKFISFQLNNLESDTFYTLKVTAENRFYLGQDSKRMEIKTLKVEVVSHWYYVGPIIAVVCIVLLAAVACFVRRHSFSNAWRPVEDGKHYSDTKEEKIRFQMTEQRQQSENTFINPAFSNTFAKPSWQELQRTSIELSSDTLIPGNIGITLVRGTISCILAKNKEACSVKMLKENGTAEDRRELMNELKTISTLSTHGNIVNLIGACTSEDGPLLLVFELCSRGTLESHLRESGKSKEMFLTKKKIDLASDVAKGMRHLAESRIVHRDLATRSIMITADFTPKIFNFGRSHDVYEHSIYLKLIPGKSSTRWLAIESLTDGVYTTKSDVWSFAVLMWEIETEGDIPYQEYEAEELVNQLKKGHRLPQPDNTSNETYKLMLQCWDENPDNRPTFAEIVQIMQTSFL